LLVLAFHLITPVAFNIELTDTLADDSSFDMLDKWPELLIEKCKNDNRRRIPTAIAMANEIKKSIPD
jgi:hypothetical protein